MQCIACALFLLTTLAVGASQEPSPSAGASIEKPESNAQKKKQRTAADQRGTESAPFIVKTLPPLGANEPAGNSAKEQHDYSSSEWWLVYLTGALACFTLGLMMYTARLWGSTKRAVEEAKTSSERQASEMQQSLAIGKEAADAAKKSADVAEQALVNLERPYVYITNVHKIGIDGDGSFIDYTTVNYGRTPAVIEEIAVEVSLTNEPFPESLLGAELNNPIFVRRVIAPHAEITLKEYFPNGINCKRLDSLEVVPVYDGSGDDLLFTIQITYDGPFTKGHATVACWRFDDDTYSFIRHGDKKLNYTK